LSIPSPRFLLDENVRRELAPFLKRRGWDVKSGARSSSDSSLAVISKTEKRVAVTNDWDFCEFTRDKIFAVIWLRIPQNDPEGLLASFEKLLSHPPAFEGRLVILRAGDWDDLPLARFVEFSGGKKKSS